MNNFSSIPSCFLFICPFAPFNGGRHIYTFQNVCIEEPQKKLGDGTIKIFLNTKGNLNDVDYKIKTFLDYIDGKKSEDPFIVAIENEIEEAKKKEAERVN